MAKKLKYTRPEIVWKDRRRYFGMPLSFTRYELTRERLIVRRGLFNTVTDEALVYRIMDIKLTRTLGQKLFGVGTIILYSTDKSDPTLLLKDIKRSDAVRQSLGELIQQQRAALGTYSSEFLGGAMSHGPGRPGGRPEPGFHSGLSGPPRKQKNWLAVFLFILLALVVGFIVWAVFFFDENDPYSQKIGKPEVTFHLAAVR